MTPLWCVLKFKQDQDGHECLNTRTFKPILNNNYENYENCENTRTELEFEKVQDDSGSFEVSHYTSYMYMYYSHC